MESAGASFMSAPSLQRSSSLSLEWSVCPGATQDAYTSVLPHGTIITANSFTSLHLLHAEFGSFERVQYEVHLLTGGLLQIGWCVTAASLPFTANEGVGDFPLSIAADGFRGVLWNLSGHPAPRLRWRPGDVLSCYADFAAGTFDYAINGRHCGTATLPTKGALLRQGSRWFTDSGSVDEMLVFAPALSLAEGEACVVNLGEAPFVYPRRGYASVELQSRCASSNSTGSGSSSSSRAVPPHSDRVCAPGSCDGAGAAAALLTQASLGGTDIDDLLAAMGIGLSGDEHATTVLRLLSDCILAPMAPQQPSCPSDAALRLTSWLEADLQARWRAFCMVLYLWVIRLCTTEVRSSAADTPSSSFSSISAASEDAHVRCSSGDDAAEHYLPEPGPLPNARREGLRELFEAVSLFMPPEQFQVVPGVLVAAVQHRVFNSAGGRERSQRIVNALSGIKSFRRAWVRETGSFCSTWLNLFAMEPPTWRDRARVAELLQKYRPSSAASAHSNEPNLALLSGAETVAWRQQDLWAGASATTDLLVRDEKCRGPLVTALLRLMGNESLRRPPPPSNLTSTPAYDDSLPYTFSLTLSEMVVAALVMSVCTAVGRLADAASGGALSAVAEPLDGLRWRATALQWLPATSFYLRNLLKDGGMPSRWTDVRVAGSFFHTRKLILDEEAALAQTTRQQPATAGAETDDSRRTSAIVGRSTVSTSLTELSDAAASVGGQDGNSPWEQPTAAPVTCSPTTHSAAANGDAASFNRRSLSRQLPCVESEEGALAEDLGEGAGERAVGDEGVTATGENASLWMMDSRYWVNRVQAVQARRGFTVLSETKARESTNNAADSQQDTGVLDETAWAERGKELLLVSVMASTACLGPLFSSTSSGLQTLSSLADRYEAARATENAARDRAEAELPAEEVDGRSTAIGTGPTGEEHPEDGEQPSSAELLAHVTVSVFMMTALRNLNVVEELSAFASVVSKVLAYYWSRMVLFERVHAFCSLGLAPLKLRHLEAEESRLCPPRAFLMLPLLMVSAPSRLWVLIGTQRQQRAAIIERCPGLLLTLYDPARRRAVSHSPTSSAILRTMASLLGFSADDRLAMARLFLEQERQCAGLNAAATRHADPAADDNTAAEPLDSADTLFRPVPLLQGSILDCLEAYLHDDDFNNSAALNFLFALAQEDGCLLPPPRLLEESSWWSAEPAQFAADARASEGLHAPTADEIFGDIFSRASAHVDRVGCLLAVVGKCNRLLTQFSQLTSSLDPAGLSAEKHADFRARYLLLRKSLYLLEFVSKRLFGLTSLTASENTAVRRTAQMAGASAAPPASAEPQHIPVETFLQSSQREVARSALMELIVQCLVRITFPAPGGRACDPTAAAAPGRVDAHLGQSVSRRVLPVASAAGALPTDVTDKDASADNVLLAARTRDANGAYCCAPAPCTVTGLLAPVLSVLGRVLGASSCEGIHDHPFLSVSSDLEVLVARANEVLSHPAWWNPASAGHCSSPVRACRFADACERIPAETQAQLRAVHAQVRAVAQAMGEESDTHRRQRVAGQSLKAQATELKSALAPTKTQTPVTPIEREREPKHSQAKAQESPILSATGDTVINRRFVAVPDEFSEEFEELEVEDESAHAAPGTEMDADTDTVCLICLERPADLTFEPCGHRCCHLCFSHSQETSSPVSHARGGLPTGSSFASVSAALAAASAAAGSAASGAVSSPSSKGIAAPPLVDGSSTRDLSTVASTYTLSCASFASTPAAGEHLRRCFLCKSVVEHVVTLSAAGQRE